MEKAAYKQLIAIYEAAFSVHQQVSRNRIENLIFILVYKQSFENAVNSYFTAPFTTPFKICFWQTR